MAKIAMESFIFWCLWEWKLALIKRKEMGGNGFEVRQLRVLPRVDG